MHASGYNFLSKLAHRIALQYPAIAQASFDLENLAHPKKDRTITQPVFISALARSGTTILLQYLYSTREFGALTYRDMPFVLMPNTWRKISRQRKHREYLERAHRDGIRIGQDSPEAFEEVFWRMFCRKDYIQKDRLAPHEVDAGTSEKFKNFISNVVDLNDGKRYLSKNNNNILRLGYLQKTFPDAIIIAPIRHPLQHAISLLEQHKLFCHLQQADPFVLDYMNWLGHFEFGLRQKPFLLDDALFLEMASRPKTDINFWLLTWKNYYQYLHQRLNDNTVLFDYDVFCADPHGVLSRLLKRLTVENEISVPVSFDPKIRDANGVDPVILKDCEALYTELKRKAARQWA